MTPAHREPRAELDAIYLFLTDKGLATESELRARGLPVGEPATVLIHISPRAGKILSQFTPEAKAAAFRPRYRWGDEVELLLSLMASERPPDLPAGALRDRDRAGQCEDKARVTQPVREALETYREPAQTAFKRTTSRRQIVSVSDIVEYLAERVLAGREQTASKRPQKGAKRWD
jgi:hypothetical protein